MREYKNFIGGEWVSSEGELTVPNLNPANTDEVLGHVRLSTREETVRAIALAKAAQRQWRKVPAPSRARVIDRVRHILEGRRDELARALSREEGKIFPEAKGEVQKSLNILEFLAGEGFRMCGRTVPSELARNLAYTVRQPIGVVGVITPWNFPVAIPLWKIAPALIAGNAVVFKPATVTPETATIICEAFEAAELPPGLVNMVLGKGSVVGDEIVANPDVQALSFTGSNGVGTRLYVEGAKRLKKVQCEMGGKNPLVVMADADLEAAAAACVKGAFGATGQRCTATSRAIVIDSVADRFVELVREKAEKLTFGDGMKPGVDVGPSVDEGQLQTVLDYMQIGKDDGAKCILGGERLTGGDFDKGFFPQPTLFDYVKPEMRIAREEVFGPVLAVLRVRDLDEAIAVANDVDFGLTSSIYTRDTNTWFQFAEEIETGITHLNSPTMGGEAQLPFGGVKATGVGAREMGWSAVEFFTEEKTVYVDYTGGVRTSNIY